MKTECPKCNSQGAWIVTSGHDTVLRCLCGLHRVLFSTLQHIVIENNDAGALIKLPKRGTFLWDTLMALQVLEPASTKQVTDQLLAMGRGFSSSDVSSYLTILRSKGLVSQLEVRRGMAGGSVWELTEAAEGLIGV